MRLAVLLMLLVPAAVFACPAVHPTINPADGSTGVPLNAEIKLADASTGTLTDGQGNAVPATESRRGSLLVLRPTGLLAPGARYTVVTDGSATASFTTGEARDDAAPPRPQPPLITHTAKSFSLGTCPDPGHFMFEWSDVADDATPAAQLMVEVLLPTSADTSGVEPSLAARCTSGTCFTSWVPSGDPRYVAGRTVDWAGNMSELTEPQPFNGCGCTSAEGFAAIAVLALLRRRARRR